MNSNVSANPQYVSRWNGMLATPDGMTLPGWRDFERSIALVFSGIASESKDIFDIRLTDPKRTGVHYGISCKMRRELSGIARHGRVTIELSNSARKFWNHLMTKGIHQANYKEYPSDVGCALIELVSEWHDAASIDRGGDVKLSKSCYLTLLGIEGDGISCISFPCHCRIRISCSGRFPHTGKWRAISWQSSQWQ